MKLTLVSLAARVAARPPRRPRYLLIPGLVRSRTDGDCHHVGASVLAMLYGVPMADCIVMPPQTPSRHRERMALLERVRCGELIGLTPRQDGDYALPSGLGTFECSIPLPSVPAP